MSWSPQPTLGGALWNGNQNLATVRQLLSSTGGLGNSIVSTGIQLTTTSNYLQTEINSIVVGGGAALWANFAAVNTVDLSGHDLKNCRYLSSMDLQVSSINGVDINFNKETVTVGGVTIVGGTVNTSNITIKPTAGGSGGGGNNPTSGGSGNNVFSMINSAVGATMDTVSKTQQAVSGVLNNTGAVLFQTYYAVETAGAIIDLANGATQLATNAQALYDTREQNLIAGPSGPPGQTSYVYETINGTTQLQFSTLGTSVYSVFRTTNQVNPNQTFGREIFTSTLIPAGSKVVRSASDPYQFNIMSTQLLSTTNYMQSFGQWHSIIEPDYNLFVSSLTANSISSLSISTGSAYINNAVFNAISSFTLSTAKAFISSINGQPISAFLNTGDATFNSISTNTISTAQITTSSLIIKGGLIFSTLAGYDITRTLTSTATLYDSVSSVTQNFLNYQMTLTSSPESFDMGSFFAITAGNEAFWSHKQLDFSQTTGQGVVDIQYGSYTNGDYFDLKNIGTVIVFVLYTFETNNFLLTCAPGTFYRLTYSSSTNNWTYAANPTQTTQTTNNTFQITQGWNTTTLSTNNLLVMKASEIVIPGALTAQAAFINNITSQNAFLSTLFVNTGVFSTLIVSTSYTQNIIDTTVSSVTGIFDTINISSLYTRFGSISSANISSLTTNGIVFTSPPNNSYNITNTFTSTVAGGYDNVSSLKQNILDYNFSANLTGEPIIYLGASFTCKNNDGSWASQYMIANSFSEVFLYTANATNYFDIQNKATTDIVTVYLSINGNLTTFLRLTPGTPIYRVTATVTAGVTVWTYAVSPGVTTPSFVQNNLTISQDLQKVYFSSMNTIQFNAGDIYMNGSLEATTAIFNNTTVQQAFISSISTGSLFAGNLNFLNATVQSLTVTSNVSSYNQVAIIQTDGNAQKVDPLEIYTNYTTVGQPSYGYYSPFRTYDNLSSINMLTSQMKYNVYDGYVNVGLGSVSNITFDSNYDLYINNVYLGRPGNKASLGFTSIPYNGSLGSFSGAMIRILTTLPNPPGTALNAFSVTLSNRSGAGGSDYVHLYGSGWNSGQVNTDIYMPTYSTGNPAIMYNQAGSNTISILAASPGTPFPNTNQTTIPNDTVSITHVPGGALSSIIQIASPILNLNSQLYWGSNTKRIAMFSMRQEAFFISKTAPGGAAYGFADVGAYVTDVKGNLFKTSEYTVNCTFGQVNAESQRTLAFNSCSLTTENVGGYWFVHCYATTATVPIFADPANFMIWVVNVLAIPTELASFQNYQPSRNVGDVVPSSIGAFQLQAQLIAPNSHLSSITASTITLQATENASFLAGGFTVPTYLSTGSVTVAGTNQVSLLANIVAIGGQTDVDIQANTNNVNIVANSTITLQGTRFDNLQGSIITSTPTYYVLNTQITSTSLVFLTPASPIDKPYWVSYNQGSNFCINVSSLATPTVMNYLVASYAGYGQQLSVSVVATGGTITTSGGYKIHTFTTSGTFTLTSPSGATIYYLVVGGGGGGGNFIAGGGGAGGLITGSTSFTATSYTITIGNGGAGNSTGANGTNGLDTTVVRNSDSSTIFDAIGGGGGGYLMGNGSSGGSGGGGGGLYSSSTSGGTATAGQGYGGAGSAYTYNHGGGGGGAGGAGSVGSAVNNNGGAGGPGLYVAAPLGATYYAGGGGGGSDAVGGGGGGAGTGGAGGAGGGGAGGSGLYLSPITGYNGTANTGGGGGGGGNDGIGYGSGTAGGDGGSGIVILAYAYP